MYSLIKPLFFALNPEFAHDIGISLIKNGALNFYKTEISEKLSVNVAGVDFMSPIGLAAGFDKNAEVFNEMYKIGFGFIESGTVTPKAQSGNPKPRIFRLKDDLALINSLGFNNVGLNTFVSNIIKNKIPNSAFKVGANLGPNKDSKDRIKDYIEGIKAVSKVVDYVTINISSPNTPGLRDFESDDITELLDEIKKGRINNIPIFIKISPDIENKKMAIIIEQIIKFDFDGLIISNTTKDRNFNFKSKNINLNGGLSGKPLLDLSNEKLSYAYNIVNNEIPLIGVGGVSSGADAYKKIKLGASLVQLYTSLVYNGPKIINEINNDLLALMELDGVTNISEIVGTSKV